MAAVRAFFIIWRDEAARRWWPVGKLIDFGSMFAFAYTRGAVSAGSFKAFPTMLKLEAIYLSNELFPVFANRVLSKNRPDYHKYADWSGQKAPEIDPLALMGTMGGERAADMLQVYPVPSLDADGFYRTSFFCHGVAHLPNASQERVEQLESGDILFPMLDTQNPFDKDAVALRTDDPTSLIGYCPRHLSFDIKDLVQKFRTFVDLKVSKVNREAPFQFKLLIEAKSIWPDGFVPCDRDDYKTIVDYENALSRILPGLSSSNKMAS